jgi:ribonucleotide monophosphatase NagD (HAD superfamily)
VTNTTKESKAYLYKLLNNLGLKIELNEIYTSLTAARKLIEEKSLRPMLFLEPGALEDFHDLDMTNPNAV